MFDVIEKSRQRGKPEQSFIFRYGPSVHDYRALTTVTEDFSATLPVFGGVNFIATPISMSNIVDTGSRERSSVTVFLPDTDPLIDLFRDYPPSYVVGLTVFEHHAGDDEMRAVWSGRVLSYNSDDYEAELRCEPIQSSMQRPGLRRRWQRSCPHVLYSTACGATTPAVSATVSLVEAGTLTFPSNWTADHASFNGGMVEWTLPDGRSERRTILESTSNGVVRLSGVAAGLSNGDAVSIFKGCNHLVTDCENVHNNILNYGGQPNIPVDNPVGIKNIYY